MAICDVLNTLAEKVGEIDLNDTLFSVEVKTGILHEVVCMQRANRRSGNACTKTRGEVSGGGAKPWKQKGTGRARAGSNRSPVWRGGGTVFGPLPRDYSYSMPKKVKKLVGFDEEGGGEGRASGPFLGKENFYLNGAVLVAGIVFVVD